MCMCVRVCVCVCERERERERERELSWMRGRVEDRARYVTPYSKHLFTTSFWRKVPESDARSVT